MGHRLSAHLSGVAATLVKKCLRLGEGASGQVDERRLQLHLIHVLQTIITERKPSTPYGTKSNRVLHMLRFSLHSIKVVYTSRHNKIQPMNQTV